MMMNLMPSYRKIVKGFEDLLYVNAGTIFDLDEQCQFAYGAVYKAIQIPTNVIIH